MNKEDYEYLMSERYSILLHADIERFGMVSFITTHFHIHYIYESLTFIITDDGTNKIIKKFNKNNLDYKSSLYGLPAQITYNNAGLPMLILYRHTDTKGIPNKTVKNYAVNNVLLDTKYYWYDENEVLLNERLTTFFNHFFMEKMFDITIDYDNSRIMTIIIQAILEGKSAEIVEAFKVLNIKSLDHLDQADSVLVEMLQL